MRSLFPGYYKPTQEEFDELWKECIFSFDANMLLNIHRYSSRSRERFFGILEKLEDRIWVCHQAAYEYNKNRLSVISGRQDPYHELQNLLDKEFLPLIKKVQETVEKYANRHSFSDYVREEQVAKPLEQVHTAIAEIKEILVAASVKCLDLDAHNQFHERLADLFEGKTGNPYSSEALEKIYIEGKKRFEANSPPGYRDTRSNKKKDPPDCYGDVVVWLQLIDYAKSQNRPIIFVTDEDGEDWWLEHRGQKQGPRPELVQEVWEKAGVRFYLYNGEQFLRYAEKFLQLPSEPAVVVEAREIRLENTSRIDPSALMRNPLPRLTADEAIRSLGLIPSLDTALLRPSSLNLNLSRLYGIDQEKLQLLWKKIDQVVEEAKQQSNQAEQQINKQIAELIKAGAFLEQADSEDTDQNSDNEDSED